MPHHAASPGRRLSWLLLLPSLLLSLNIVADGGEADYDAGIAAFESGDYRRAADRFRAAQAAGFDDPALDYNLGASYFRLGDYEAARANFLKTAQAPQFAALAYYNLGLTAARLGDEDEARGWLQLALDAADNDTLRVLATTLLERVGGEAETGMETETGPARAAWQGFLNGGLGHDSNVLLVSDDAILSSSDRSDFFLDVFGHAWRERQLGGGAGRHTLEFDASLWLLRHHELDDYDVASLRAGGSVDRVGATWLTSGGLHALYTQLDTRGFTREALLDLRASRRLQSGLLRLRYELGRIDAIGSEYRYLDGWRHRVDARMIWPHDAARVQLHYQIETNHRTDLREPLFTSSSAVRNTLSLSADIPLGAALDLRSELQYQHSRYRDPNELAGGETITRVDGRLSVLGRLTHTLAGGDEVSFEYRYMENNSTIGFYEYDRHRLMLGWLTIF